MDPSLSAFTLYHKVMQNTLDQMRQELGLSEDVLKDIEEVRASWNDHGCNWSHVMVSDIDGDTMTLTDSHYSLTTPVELETTFIRVQPPAGRPG